MPIVEVAYGIGIPAIITGIVQVAVVAGLPKKLSPLLAVIIGLGLALLLRSEIPAESLGQVVLVGLYWGLVPVGMYSGTKSIIDYCRNGNCAPK